MSPSDNYQYVFPGDLLIQRRNRIYWYNLENNLNNELPTHIAKAPLVIDPDKGLEKNQFMEEIEPSERKIYKLLMLKNIAYKESL
jgi:hypothetical protein